MKPDHKEMKQNANTMLGTGTGLAAFSAGTALTIGVTCPLCVIAAPLLIGAGVVGRIRAAKQKQREPEVDTSTTDEGAIENG